MVDDKTKLTFTTAQDTIINSYFEEWHDIMANESGTDKRLGRSDPPDYPNAITPKKWCERISKRFNNHKKIKVTATGLAGLTPVVQSSTTHDSNLTSTSTFFCCGALTGRMLYASEKRENIAEGTTRAAGVAHIGRYQTALKMFGTGGKFGEMELLLFYGFRELSGKLVHGKLDLHGPHNSSKDVSLGSFMKLWQDFLRLVIPCVAAILKEYILQLWKHCRLTDDSLPWGRTGCHDTELFHLPVALGNPDIMEAADTLSLAQYFMSCSDNNAAFVSLSLDQEATIDGVKGGSADRGPEQDGKGDDNRKKHKAGDKDCDVAPPAKKPKKLLMSATGSDGKKGDAGDGLGGGAAVDVTAPIGGDVEMGDGGSGPGGNVGGGGGAGGAAVTAPIGSEVEKGDGGNSSGGNTGGAGGAGGAAVDVATPIGSDVEKNNDDDKKADGGGSRRKRKRSTKDSKAGPPAKKGKQSQASKTTKNPHTTTCTGAVADNSGSLVAVHHSKHTVVEPAAGPVTRKDTRQRFIWGELQGDRTESARATEMNLISLELENRCQWSRAGVGDCWYLTHELEQGWLEPDGHSIL
ncbi:hypothetical protein B0H10DRAFT_1964368 [Mycena sp. CBHHK59/15]|nr:hypothetical protein B0H10DRAFT_1964368 [Mycena sp. CBHHK59/15]